MKLGFHKRRALISRIILCCMTITLALSVQAFAENMSVNDLIGTDLGSSSSFSQSEQSSANTQSAPEVAQPSSSNSSSGTENQANSSGTGNTGNTGASSSGSAATGDVYNGIASSSKVDLNNPKAAQATSGLKNIVGIIVSFLCYAIVILMTLRVVIDILYVTIPYTRGILCRQGPGGAGGMMGAGGMSGGYGGMNGGYGGMNSGFGGMSGGYGGMNGGYGGGMQPPMSGQQQAGRGIGGIQWVSNAAMQAVAMDNQPGAAFKIYAKDMMVVLIVTPILLVLATNGSLITLGFKLAGFITGLIAKISGSIG